MEEEKKEQVVEEKKQEIPKGYHVAEAPTGYARVVAIGDKVVDADELLAKVANAVTEAGLMK